jgi:hypothetical protein
MIVIKREEEHFYFSQAILSSQGKRYSSLRSSLARDTVTKLSTTIERCDATCALRLTRKLRWMGLHRKFTGNSRLVPERDRMEGSADHKLR